MTSAAGVSGFATGPYGGKTGSGPVPRCSSCHASIWWGLTVNGKHMPLDPQPVESGNVIVDQDMRLLDKLAVAYEGDGPPAEGTPIRVLKKAETPDPDAPRYVAHFATCPSAVRHRRAS